MRILAVAVAMLLLFTARVYAETEHELEVGVRLRIRTSGVTAEYVLEAIGADSLTVLGRNDSELRQLAFDQVQRIDMRVARSPGWGAIRGAAIGGAIGAVGGAIYAVSTWDDVDVDCGPFDETCSAAASGLRFVGSVGIFGMSGMLIGGVVGAMSPGERWQSVNLPVSIGISFDDDRALYVQFSFAF